MIIIETCPKCGYDLVDEMICTMPPIPQKVCYNCGWSWTGEREKIIRVPFEKGNSFNYNTALHGNEDCERVASWNTLTSTYNNATETIKALTKELQNYENKIVKESFAQPACTNCSSNPKNGGSGICGCTLGQFKIT